MAKQVIVFEKEFLDLNEYIKIERTHRIMAANAKKAETEMAAWFVQGVKPIKKYPVKIAFKWFCPNKRKDPDNISFGRKAILDGLVMGGVLSGDGWKQIAGFSDEFFVDKSNPRVEIELSTACLL